MKPSSSRKKPSAGNKPKPSARVSSKSAKPSTPKTVTTLQSRAYQGQKRGPKFRASGGDNPIERTIPVPAQRFDHAARLHTKYRNGALRRIGVKPEQLTGVPRISHILDHAEGGMATVIAALRLSDDGDAGKFLAQYDKVSITDAKYLTVEEISVAAGVDTKRLLELAVSALVEDGRSAGAIVAATYHPRVIKATAQAALDNEVYFDSMGTPHFKSGHNDRKLFLQGTGFLPQSNRGTGGVFVNITNQTAAQLRATQAETDILEAGNGGDQFNAAEDDLRRVHELIDGNRLLEAPKVVESPASMVLGHQYREMSEVVEELDCIPNQK